MEKIFTVLIIMVLALNLILTIATPLSALIINFVCRSDLDGWAYQGIKEDKLGGYSWVNREPNIIFLDILMPLIITMLLGLLVRDVPVMITGLMYTTLFLLTLPLIRWLVDVSRNLRVKKDTGDSAELQEMQNEIEELKKAIASSSSNNTNSSQKG